MTNSTLPVRGISIDWNLIEDTSYLHAIPALRRLQHLSFSKPVTFFSGENGSGKSTLLEAIAITSGFSPEGGTLNYAFSTKDTHSSLHTAMRLIRNPGEKKYGYFLRAESFYNVATMEEEYARGPGGVAHQYHEKSHGESYLALAQDYFHGRGFYLLDEPEAALSPQRQLSLLREIYDCTRQGAQFVIATHSPILLGMPNSEILSFDEGQIHAISYEETQSYQITSMFINAREQLLRHLLED